MSKTKRRYRISRRIGKSLWGTKKDAVHTRNYPPGQHGVNGRRKKVGYGEQFENVQVLKAYYGNMKMSQFKKVAQKAMRMGGDNNENLIGLLESRLDAVIYRARFAKTPFAAKQLINHKHVCVNGKVVNIPSYTLKAGDVVSIRDRARGFTVVLDAIENSEHSTPDYIEKIDGSQFEVKYSSVPKFADVPYPVEMHPHSVIELFSR